MRFEIELHFFLSFFSLYDYPVMCLLCSLLSYKSACYVNNKHHFSLELRFSSDVRICLNKLCQWAQELSLFLCTLKYATRSYGTHFSLSLSYHIIPSTNAHPIIWQNATVWKLNPENKSWSTATSLHPRHVAVRHCSLWNTELQLLVSVTSCNVQWRRMLFNITM